MMDRSKWQMIFVEDFNHLGDTSRNFSSEPPWGRTQIDRERETQYFAPFSHASEPFSRANKTEISLSAKKTKRKMRMESLLQPFSSACLSSHGRIEFQYGVVGVRASLPSVHGVCAKLSLIQMNGPRSMPAPQEIVIAQRIGKSISHSYHSYPHELSNVRRMIEFKSKTKPTMARSEYHVVVEPGWITWLIDGKVQGSKPMPLAMYGARWCVCVQLLTGNELSWGLPDMNIPISMPIDWVKLYSTEITRGDAVPSRVRDVKSPVADLEQAPVSPSPNSLQVSMDIHRALKNKRRKKNKKRLSEPASVPEMQRREKLETVARSVDPDFSEELQQERKPSPNVRPRFLPCRLGCLIRAWPMMKARNPLNLLILSALVPLAGCSLIPSHPQQPSAPEPVVIVDDGLEFGEYRFDSSRNYLPTFCNTKTGRCFVHGIDEAQAIVNGVCSVPAQKPLLPGIKSI